MPSSDGECTLEHGTWVFSSVPEYSCEPVAVGPNLCQQSNPYYECVWVPTGGQVGASYHGFFSGQSNDDMC